MRKSCLQLSLIILTDFHSFTVNEDKLENQSTWRCLLKSRYTILVKIWKWLKLLNCVPFIKKIWGNHVYNWIWSLWLTLIVLRWLKRNLKICQFSRFLLRSLYVILLKIWRCLKLLNSVLIIEKTPVNHVYIRIWSFWLTSTVLQWMKTNFKISQFSGILLI